MTLNLEKVKKYAAERIEKEYKRIYPHEITDFLTVSTCGGSFGSCLLSLTYENDNPNKLNEVECKYVSNYNAVDGVISRFFVRNYDLMACRVFERHQKEKEKGLSCVLEIFNDSEKVNEIIFDDPESVKSELVKIIIAEKRRGVRTTYKPKPYTQDMDIIERWTREEAHTTKNIKYVYHFHNLDY